MGRLRNWALELVAEATQSLGGEGGMVVWSALSGVKYDSPSEWKRMLALWRDSFHDSFALRRE